MKCINKNPHYKSTSEFYNATAQTLTSNAAPLNLIGSQVTNTGVAVDTSGTTIDIKYSGTYAVKASVIADITTAGDVTVQLYANGVPLPETLRTVTLAVGNNAIDIDTVRFFKASCADSAQVQIYVNTDGTAVGSVAMISGNVVKLA